MSNLTKEKQSALNWLTDNRALVAALGDEVWRNAEPALREYASARAHVDFLRSHGFTVETGIAGLPTAFVGTYGSGKPVIGFYAEYDATPGNSQKPVAWREPFTPQGAGFEDTHNSLGAGSSGAAVATKRSMEEHGFEGTIKIFGTPAEKLCIGKPYQARDGYYDDLDAAVCWHPWGHNTCTYDAGPGCYEAVIFEFHGLQAYGGRPWRGVSALDGAVLMNVLANFQKEHIPRDHLASVNELVTVGGQCPTDLPEYSQVWYVFRAMTREGIEEILEMLKRCGEAAALAIGCDHEMRIVSGTRPWLPNHAMAELAFRNLELVGPPQLTEEDKAFARELQAAVGIEPMDEPFDLSLRHPKTESATFYGGADDVNEFCWSAPTCFLHTTYKFLGSPRNFDLPSWAPAALAGTNVAHQCALTAAKAVALTAVDLFTRPHELEKAQAEYRERTKGGVMPVAVPDGVEPPNEAIYSFPPFYPEGWSPPVGRTG